METNTTSGFHTCQIQWLTGSAFEGLADPSRRLSVGGREKAEMFMVSYRFTTGGGLAGHEPSRDTRNHQQSISDCYRCYSRRGHQVYSQVYITLKWIFLVCPSQPFTSCTHRTRYSPSPSLLINSHTYTPLWLFHIYNSVLIWLPWC